MPFLRPALAVALLLIGTAARADDTTYVAPGDGFEWTVVAAGATVAMAWHPAARGPFGPAKGTAKTAFDAVTPVAVDHERVAALYLRRHFVVAEVPAVLELRARYHDALVARINGVEVARSNLPAGTASAARARGGERESFFIAAAGVVHAGDNVLEVEVRPTGKRGVPAADVELDGRSAPRVVRGPILQRVGVASATIVFDTDLAIAGEVRYGAAAGTYDHHVTDEPRTHHAVVLDGLHGDAAVHYAVVLPGGAATPDVAFHTAPRPGEVVRFAIYGDVTSGHEVHAEIARSIIGEAPDFVVTAGDLVARGDDHGDWQRFFAVAAPLLARFPMYPVVGNHELGAGEGRMDDEFVLPDRPRDTPAGAAWYSFDVGDVHIAMLDSNRYDDDRQLRWLELDLVDARARHARAIFAVAHQGPFSRGPHGGNAVAAHRYVPVLTKYGATAFLAGHDHFFQRGQVGDLAYFVTGGGGSSLYKAACGVPHKPDCPADGMQSLISAHHYLSIEVYRDAATVCPKRPDGTPLEPCTKVRLAK